MESKQEKKVLYSFYVDPARLERLKKLSGFLTVKNSKNVSVSVLINTAIEQYLDRNQEAIDAIEKLAEEVVFSGKE